MVGRHGLLLRKGGRSGLLLPQVPVGLESRDLSQADLRQGRPSGGRLARERDGDLLVRGRGFLITKRLAFSSWKSPPALAMIASAVSLFALLFMEKNQCRKPRPFALILILTLHDGQLRRPELNGSDPRDSNHNKSSNPGALAWSCSDALPHYNEKGPPPDKPSRPRKRALPSWSSPGFGQRGRAPRPAAQGTFGEVRLVPAIAG